MFNDTRKKHVAIAPSFGCKLSFLRSTESNIKWGSVVNDRENHPPGEETTACSYRNGDPWPGGWRSPQPMRVVHNAHVSTGEGGTGKLDPGPRSSVWLQSRKNLAQISVSLLFVMGSVNTQ